MTKIKICGLLRLEDAHIVNEGHPDFAGFVLTPSKRQVTIIQADAISKLLSPSIKRVGVFAKETPEEIAEAASILELDGIQLHLDTAPAFLEELMEHLRRYPFRRKPFLWQRLPVPSFDGSEARGELDPKANFAARYASFPDLSLFDGLLFDAFHDGQDGGTGKTFEWKSALDYLEDNRLDSSRIIIAGGLTAENVADAVSVFSPYAVDVSSGVETNGYKDREKVLRFIETARKAQVHE